MEEIIYQNNQVAQYIKSTILKYAPLVDSREELFDMVNSIVETQITVSEKASHITFLHGTGSDLSATNDCIKIEKSIAFEEIKKVIDFLLEDHRIISDIDLFGPYYCENMISLKFPINWTNESIEKGINCHTILLSLVFDNGKLMEQYVSMLFKQYNEELSKTPTVKRMNGNHIGSKKYYWIKNAKRPEILELLSRLSEEELKILIKNLDNGTFMKYLIPEDPEEKNDDDQKSFTLRIPTIQ